MERIGKSPRGKSGFTLIELILAAAIIGLLASIAIPKFGNLIIKAKEASVKAKLGDIRSALSIYYADNEGYGGNAALGLGFLRQKYLDEIPSISIPTWPQHYYGNLTITCSPSGVCAEPDGWKPGSPFGPIAWNLRTKPFKSIEIFDIGVNCSHLDSTGRIWSTW